MTLEQIEPAVGGATRTGKLAAMVLAPGARPAAEPAVVAGARTWTRADVAAEVAATAARLRAAGLGAGDRVLVILDHDLEGIVFLAAASALGLRLLMPYNLASAALPEWLSIAATARPDAVVVLGSRAPVAAELGGAGRVIDLAAVPVPAGPPAELPVAAPVAGFLVLFTSGTTGAPKAISVSEATVARRVAAVSAQLAFAPDSRIFMSGLLNNTTGVIFSFGAFLHGATLVLPQGRDLATWPEQVATTRATHMMLRPVALKRFVEAATARPVDLSALRMVAYGAAAMPQAVLEAGRRLMPCAWAQGYGLSETYGPFCWLDEEAHAAGAYRTDTYCVGTPDATAEVRLAPVDGGGLQEVLVRTDVVMEGYLDVATGTLRRPGEWLRTGDVGAWSPAGRLLLKGRIANSVLSSDGHRIYPEEVEAVLAAVPGVDDAVLLGLVPPGAPPGTPPRPVACLCGPLGAAPPAEVLATVTAALAAALSPEKWPEQIWATDTAFARGDNDKVLRARVAERAAAGPLLDLTTR